ncbi:glutaminase [Mollisia scopiformis]|uniref:Glutaminase n=1 Tax=Mollisia scopiformis TaxID=149040 RepID=A0A194X264_MOLSC|nr:glutaminase [Mollisia scopiformis]KUJ14290.1 glutaminase [Mollisia scopiformis]
MWRFLSTLPFYILSLPPNANAATYKPVLPPSYPLAVRNPYLSAWVPGNQVANLPTATPQFWAGQDLSWSVLTRIDGTTYKIFGAPAALTGSVDASLVSAEYTSSHSLFTLTAGPITVVLDFFSPVSPKNYLRQSLPFSYLTVSVSGTASHEIQVYSDIDESWTGQSGNTVGTFNSSFKDGLSIFELSVNEAYLYSENSESQALWGENVFASKPTSSSNLSSEAGSATSVRERFATNGTLSGATTFSDGYVVSLAHDLGSTSNSSVTFVVGYVREAAINYLGSARTGYYRASYPDTGTAVSYFLDDYTSAYSESLASDATLEQKALAAAGSNYSDILLLTTRQAYGGADITIPNDTLNTTDIMIFLKEISSDGNVNTLDVIFPAFPIWYVMSPDYIRYQLEPVLQYLETGLWTQLSSKSFCIHDIGTHYPNATGHNNQIEEDMPVEESGNVILLAYAYVQATGDLAWAEKYQNLFTKYANFLVTGGLDEPVQLATNDCCGPLANQTNLAIKAAIALNAYGKLFNASSYSDTGLSFANELYTKGLGLDSERTHFKLQYGTNVTFGNDSDYAVVFNIYTDILFNFQTFPASTYTMLASYYPTIQGVAGVPLDSRVDWSSTFWTNWAGAASPGKDNETRDLFINDVWSYMTNGLNTPPFSDRWFAVPGSGGLVGGSGDLIGGYDAWRNRPVVGGHFAVLALEGADQF